ncbi:MAG TPA: hypothetical protein VG713_07670, partial [Pirellulales bacterium]|nr:hypothetical protein [Pirellulales bacterium]
PSHATLTVAQHGSGLTSSGLSDAEHGALMSIAACVSGGHVAASLSDKTGFKLSADGLDAISIDPPSSVASTFREMVVQTWRRFFAKATKTSSTLTTFADDGDTAITTQPLTDDGNVQTQGSAA